MRFAHDIRRTPTGRTAKAPQLADFFLSLLREGLEFPVVALMGVGQMTQRGMEALFNVSKSTLSEHLRNVYASGELLKEATVRNFRTVQTEGGREVARNLDYYNLDAIISVGYRVNSYEATQFRIWAIRLTCNCSLQKRCSSRRR